MEGVITRKQIAGITIEIQETRIGDDIVLILAGGDKPHIGCVVQAVPRPSLTNDGSISVTSSVLNLTGHKDEFLCRKLAEKRKTKKAGNSVFDRLLAAGQRLIAVIHKNKEIANKDMAKFADQINALCDKWDR